MYRAELIRWMWGHRFAPELWTLSMELASPHPLDACNFRCGFWTSGKFVNPWSNVFLTPHILGKNGYICLLVANVWEATTRLHLLESVHLTHRTAKATQFKFITTYHQVPSLEHSLNTRERKQISPLKRCSVRNVRKRKKLRHSVQYSTVQYSTVQYSTVQYSTVQYSTTKIYKYRQNTTDLLYSSTSGLHVSTPLSHHQAL